MTLDPRRIALQGIGSAAFAIAVQGFAATAALTASPTAYYGGGKGGVSEIDTYHDWRAELVEKAEARRVHAQNQLIVAAVMAAMAQGLF